MARTITSANSVFTLFFPDVSPVPVNLQGYAVDDAFDNDLVNPVEPQMGVDGIMSGGFTPFMTKILVTLQANSASNDFLQSILGAMDATTEALEGSGSIKCPSVGKNWDLDRVFLTGIKQLPGAKKVLTPQHYELTVQKCLPSLTE